MKKLLVGVSINTMIHFLYFTEGCNNYLKTIGYSISVKNCDVRKKIDISFITRETPLFCLIPEHATNEQRDIIFFLVIEDIVSTLFNYYENIYLFMTGRLS